MWLRGRTLEKTTIQTVRLRTTSTRFTMGAFVVIAAWVGPVPGVIAWATIHEADRACGNEIVPESTRARHSNAPNVIVASRGYFTTTLTTESSVQVLHAECQLHRPGQATASEFQFILESWSEFCYQRKMKTELVLVLLSVVVRGTLSKNCCYPEKFEIGEGNESFMFLLLKRAGVELGA